MIDQARQRVLAAVAGAAIALASGAAQAGCSNRTIRGDYAFTVQGNVLGQNDAVVGLISGVGIVSNDGNGNFTQQDYTLINTVQIPGEASNPSGFHTDQSGTYTVNADCTGNSVLRTGPGNEIHLAFVISNNGNSMHSVVTRALVGGNPVKFQTRADHERISPRD